MYISLIVFENWSLLNMFQWGKNTISIICKVFVIERCQFLLIFKQMSSVLRSALF